MIQLHNDCLLFQTSTGEMIPCSVELVAIELVGDAAAQINPELVRQAAAAVLHYFKYDLGRTAVSIDDFSKALERVLRSLGLAVRPGEPMKEVESSDLRELVPAEAFELTFFPHLRDELRRRLQASPEVLRFRGLRACVKTLLKAKRWNRRCQELSDQIVDYMRQCLTTEACASPCGLVIR